MSPRPSGEAALVTLLLLALCLSISFQSLSLRPPAGTLPLVVGMFTSCVLAVQFVLDLRRPSGPPPDARAGRRAALFVAAFVLALDVGGFVVVLPLASALYLRVRTGASWRQAALAGFGAFLAVAAGFGWLLDAPLHHGVWPRWFDLRP